MRALCGAIITAGAVIGLGLAAIGFGGRYQILLTQLRPAAEGKGLTREQLMEQIHHVDTPMLYIVVFLTCVAIIGLGIAFLGLAYHHHRRYHEFLREHGHLTGQARVPFTPAGSGPTATP